MEAFARGHAAGVIASRLAQHDAHFTIINGSIDRFTKEMQNMVLAMQRVSDQAEAARVTALVTAQALKDADDTRRALGEKRFVPWARGAVLVGALGALLGGSITFMNYNKQPTEVRIVRPDVPAPVVKEK